jgi:glycosyltransferase involved in cell wall biosynthesis
LDKIRIAYFADILEENFDGVTHTIYQVMKRVPKQEFDFLFVTPHPPKPETNFPFRVITCPSVGMPGNSDYRIALPFLKRSIQTELEAFDPDLIHFTTPSFLGRYALDFGQKRGIPVINTYHSHFHAYLEYYFKFLPGGSGAVMPIANRLLKIYQESDLTLVPSNAMRDFLLDWQVDAGKIKLWQRGVESSKYNPGFRSTEFRKKWGLGSHKTILFVSRLVKEKEIDTLADIYQLFQQRRPDVKFLVVGSGPGEDELKDKMPNAVFTGKLTGQDLATCYASSDLFVFPSISETFGNVVLEALASGLPVVTAAEGGPVDIVTHGVNGFHVTPKDPESFYSKLVLLLENEALYDSMRTEAVSYAETQNWDALCANLFDLYKEYASLKLAVSA